MCSLSFLPDTDGFHLLMNRDEKIPKPTDLPPAHRCCGDLQALYPLEKGEGTWIGINEAGVTLALMHWKPREVEGRLIEGEVISRSTIIPVMLRAESPEHTRQLLMELTLSRIHPFRLFVMSRASRHIREWKSNGSALICELFPWERRHWFSSGQDEDLAVRERRKICRHAEKDPDAETLPWLRRLHRSHDPMTGGLSLCMHRQDEGTVSCTEISLNGSHARMKYHPGPPCHPAQTSESSLLCS